MPKDYKAIGRLMGPAEVAEYLGWPPRKVAAYLATEKAGIPKPIVRLKMGPVWRKSDIERWARERGYVK